MTYAEETIEIAKKSDFGEKVVAEVHRLLLSGAVEPEDHNRGLLFGVALENVADNYLRGEKSSRDYKNLRRF